MPECFIVMPISTVAPALYVNDAEHFRHVLDHLFVPAVRKAGMTPIPPIAEGSDLIHAEIIKNIERADLVLCDMSTLNPNVFFELGIRTALNKPVCAVKDDVTPSVPFDTTMLNYHTYLSALTPWTLERQIESLAAHITKGKERSAGQNPMWKYFGVSASAHMLEDGFTTEESIELLQMQIADLARRIDPPQRLNRLASLGGPGETVFRKLVSLASAAGLTVTRGSWEDDERTVTLEVENNHPDQKTVHLIQEEAAQAGYQVAIRAVGA